MIAALLKILIGNVAGAAADKVSRVVELGAIAAVATPALLWFKNGGKDEVLVSFTLTYGQALVIALAAWWLVRVLNRSTPPAPRWFPPREGE